VSIMARCAGAPRCIDTVRTRDDLFGFGFMGTISAGRESATGVARACPVLVPY
jgi:hypothetical protein